MKRWCTHASVVSDGGTSLVTSLDEYMDDVSSPIERSTWMVYWFVWSTVVRKVGAAQVGTEENGAGTFAGKGRHQALSAGYKIH